MIPFGPSWFGGAHGRAADWHEAFQFATKAERQTSLDALSSLINWPQADQVLASLYPYAKGEKAWALTFWPVNSPLRARRNFARVFRRAFLSGLARDPQ